MRVLVGCEFSGVVRDAFRQHGHDAFSCDVRPSERGEEYHLQGDLLTFLSAVSWDLLIAHPPCTDLCVSGARWFAQKRADGRQENAKKFFMAIAKASIPRIAIENPVGIMSSAWRKPDQIIQPWQFGHGETKATCLWLKGLPLLKPTNIVDGRVPRIHLMPPGPNRERERSRTYAGIAEAMAAQWGEYSSVLSQGIA